MLTEEETEESPRSHPLSFSNIIDDDYINESKYLLSPTSSTNNTTANLVRRNVFSTTGNNDDDDRWYLQRTSFIRRVKSLETYIPSTESISELTFVVIWNVLFSCLAACICFWIPGFTVWGISITSVIKNSLGCFFIAIATAFQGVKFQYYQTYIMYDAIKGGFLSVFTSFGNFIEDNDILLQMRFGYIKAPLNYLATLVLSFIFYQTGRLVALKWKAGAAFSFDLMVMENENHRMAFELKKNNDNTSYNAQLRDHLDQQMVKRKRHQSKKLQLRHLLIMFALMLVPLLTAVAVGLISHFDLTVIPSSVNSRTYKIMWFEFLVSMFWCVSGALSGRFVSGFNTRNKQTDVQWGTFRVNILSCIFIGTAHNILFLRDSFPYGTTRYFEIIFRRFISDFCGSESNYAGLIDETSVLWNSKRVSRWTPLKNLFYNLIVGTFVFFLVVFGLRIILFGDMRVY